MSEGSTQATPSAVESSDEDKPDWLTWPEGTVLPDEMIDKLRETIGALDALLASTYLSRDFELPGPDELMPKIPSPHAEAGEQSTPASGGTKPPKPGPPPGPKPAGPGAPASEASPAEPRGGQAPDGAAARKRAPGAGGPGNKPKNRR
jgi:hypothetical protein